MKECKEDGADGQEGGERWPEAAEKARYLIGLFATTSIGRDPRRRKLIAAVLEDSGRRSGEPAVAADDERGSDAER